MRIIVTETTQRHGKFNAHLEGGTHLTTSTQPFFDSARELLRRGYHPNTPIAMRHHGSATDSLTSAIGDAAKLIAHDGRFIPGPRCQKRRSKLEGLSPVHKTGGPSGGDRAQPIFAISEAASG